MFSVSAAGADDTIVISIGSDFGMSMPRGRRVIAEAYRRYVLDGHRVAGMWHLRCASRKH